MLEWLAITAEDLPLVESFGFSCIGVLVFLWIRLLLNSSKFSVSLLVLLNMHAAWEHDVSCLLIFKLLFSSATQQTNHCHSFAKKSAKQFLHWHCYNIATTIWHNSSFRLKRQDFTFEKLNGKPRICLKFFIQIQIKNDSAGSCLPLKPFPLILPLNRSTQPRMSNFLWARNFISKRTIRFLAYCRLRSPKNWKTAQTTQTR